MYLSYDLLVLRNLVRSVVLVPLDPVPPHLDYFLPVELSRDAEASNCVNIGVKVPLSLKGLILSLEDLDDLLSVCLDLSQLAVGGKKWVGC
jgi:hypothetical protein